MEIQKYNVIVYFMLVLKKKHLRVTSFKDLGAVFHSKVQLQALPRAYEGPRQDSPFGRFPLQHPRSGQRIGVISVFPFIFSCIWKF